MKVLYILICLIHFILADDQVCYPKIAKIRSNIYPFLDKINNPDSSYSEPERTFIKAYKANGDKNNDYFEIVQNANCQNGEKLALITIEIGHIRKNENLVLSYNEFDDAAFNNGLLHIGYKNGVILTPGQVFQDNITHPGFYSFGDDHTTPHGFSYNFLIILIKEKYIVKKVHFKNRFTMLRDAKYFIEKERVKKYVEKAEDVVILASNITKVLQFNITPVKMVKFNVSSLTSSSFLHCKNDKWMVTTNDIVCENDEKVQEYGTLYIFLLNVGTFFSQFIPVPNNIPSPTSTTTPTTLTPQIENESVEYDNERNVQIEKDDSNVDVDFDNFLNSELCQEAEIVFTQCNLNKRRATARFTCKGDAERLMIGQHIYFHHATRGPRKLTSINFAKIKRISRDRNDKYGHRYVTSVTVDINSQSWNVQIRDIVPAVYGRKEFERKKNSLASSSTSTERPKKGNHINDVAATCVKENVCNGRVCGSCEFKQQLCEKDGDQSRMKRETCTKELKMLQIGQKIYFMYDVTNNGVIKKEGEIVSLNNELQLITLKYMEKGKWTTVLITWRHAYKLNRFQNQNSITFLNKEAKGNIVIGMRLKIKRTDGTEIFATIEKTKIFDDCKIAIVLYDIPNTEESFWAARFYTDIKELNPEVKISGTKSNIDQSNQRINEPPIVDPLAPAKILKEESTEIDLTLSKTSSTTTTTTTISALPDLTELLKKLIRKKIFVPRQNGTPILAEITAINDENILTVTYIDEANVKKVNNIPKSVVEILNPELFKTLGYQSPISASQNDEQHI